MNHDDVLKANRTAWEETATVHAETTLTTLLEQVARPGFSTLDQVEREVFGSIGLKGKDVAQLCCNNARELLSLKLEGAGRCVGFDFSDAFLEQGRQLASAARTDIELISGDVLAIPTRFSAAFDIVYVTVGALGWFPDLQDFFATAARLLKAGGVLFVYEMHPMLDMFDAGAGLEIRHSYFRREPYCNENQPDYLDPGKRIAATSYWFHHKLADILGACIKNGLQITRFDEFEDDISTIYAQLSEISLKPAMSYALLASKSYSV